MCIRDSFDHVLLMGPLYHLLAERDRVRAVEAALALLRPGGLLFASFSNLSSGMVYAMKEDPGCVLWQSECEYLSCFLQGRSFAGDGFTRAFFAPPREVRPFFSRFPLEEKHLFGQEGLCSPCEDRLVSQPREVQDQWVKLSLQEKMVRRELHIIGLNRAYYAIFHAIHALDGNGYKLHKDIIANFDKQYVCLLYTSRCV